MHHAYHCRFVHPQRECAHAAAPHLLVRMEALLKHAQTMRATVINALGDTLLALPGTEGSVPNE